MQSQSQHSDGEALSLDTVYHVLQSERRRVALAHVLRVEQTDIDEVTDVVAAAETAGEVTDEQRKRVYISLYQSHFPMLAEHDIVTYDEGTKSIARGEQLDRFKPYLQAANQPESSRQKTALVAGIGCLAVVIAGLLLGVGSIPPLLTTGLMGLTALYTTTT